MTIETARPDNYFDNIGAKKPHVKSKVNSDACDLSPQRTLHCQCGRILMEFGGRYRLDAPRVAVWAGLNDTAMLKAAIPGCHRIDWVGAEALELEIKVNLGVVHPVFKGDLVLTDIVPAASYTLTGKGRGGLLGFAEGAADIILSDDGDGTELTFVATGGASGQIMRLGKAVIGSSAQKIIDGFFKRFADAMGVSITVLPPQA
ncbi:carbon monoxide dehydrogenase subunit G [Devosia rhodophyticola]|uniref:Carbon monoxide dehydrogenase subunit G n=1 Tax=Devosia rhodophyticola TaxID=3026423 RepID=A0ABY7YZN2_9HYPH|nr:carbon monoxide dehydrogenase subunit G [Devosia rhodophyticola]WDR06791.1 carbon monoxide dehydrogenase subunit G [Devosia rhodophyticola]